MGNQPIKIAFWGDSLTEGAPGYSFFEIVRARLGNCDLYNFGYAGDTINTLHHRLIHEKQQPKYELIFLWIGTNDVFMYPEDYIEEDKQGLHKTYQDICNRLLKYTPKLIVVPPLIIGETIENPWNKIAEKISREISGISSSNKKIEYLDLRSKFLDEIKKNPTGARTTDGVHLNEYGAMLIAGWILEKIRKKTS